MEDFTGFTNRIESAQEYLKEYMLSSDIPEDSKIVVVAHSCLLRTWCNRRARKVDLGNCEMIGWTP